LERIIDDWSVFIKELSHNTYILNSINNIKNNNDAFFTILREALPSNQKSIMVNIPASVEQEFCTFFNYTRTNEPVSRNLGKMLAVKERDNTREALLQIPLGMYANSSFKNYISKYSFKKMPIMCLIYLQVHSDHPLYNYIDEGNHFYSKFSLIQDGTVITKIGKAGTSYQYMEVIHHEANVRNYNENYLIAPYRKKVKTINSNFTGDGDQVSYKNVVISNNGNAYDILYEIDLATEDTFKNIPKKELMQLSRLKENLDSSKKLMLKLASLEEEESIELMSGINISPTRVSYSGQYLESNSVTPEELLFNTKAFFPKFAVSSFSNQYIYTPLLNQISVEQLDWDRYLDTFLRYHWLQISCLDNPIMQLTIGSVQVKLEYKPHSKFFYINDRRIIKDEVVPVLLKALCYSTKEEFDDVVKAISRTSLELHGFLAEGLTVHLNIATMDKELKEHPEYAQYLAESYFDVSFKIVRMKNINYIELGKDRLVRIKNTRPLLSLQKSDISYEKMKKLFGDDTKVLSEPVNIEADIGNIIKVAKQRYVAAFEKSKRLLSDAIEETHAEKLTSWGKNKKKGIKVTGSSGNTYFIEVSNLDDPLKGNPTCGVYHYSSGSHICIVDKSGGGHQAGVDKVVARLYALRNDSVLAEHIHTLRRYVDNPEKE